MQHPTHPDDERLAALAGGDPEVTADAALRAHVDTCDRCAALVSELGSLRTALAELPDLVPSRPLQLLPPLAEPEPKAASGGWLRRLAAPAMAAGFVLVVVGAIGTSGFTLGLGASAGAAPTYENADGEPGVVAGEGSEATKSPTAGRGVVGASGGESAVPRASGEDSAQRSDSGQPSAAASQGDAAPPAEEGSGTPNLFAPSDPRLPWLVVLGFGVGLLLAGIYLRFARQPRAG